MANRLEETIWGEAADTLVDKAEALSYVKVKNITGCYLTSSIKESYRINRPYILEAKDTSFFKALQESFAAMATGPIDRSSLALTLR